MDVFRGYLAQRLLWEIDGHLGFVRPNAHREFIYGFSDFPFFPLISHDILEYIVPFLYQWTCPRNLSFYGCLSKLSVDMVQESFCDSRYLELVHSWLEILKVIGYPEPKRILPVEKPKVVANDTNAALAQRQNLTLSRGSFANFVPAFTRNKANHLTRVKKACKTVPYFDISRIKIRSDIFANLDKDLGHDILLIVIFNFFQWFSDAVIFLEAMHRYRFPNILYCGEDTNGSIFMKASEKLGVKVSFIDVHVNRGFEAYHCLTMASYMSYNVSGYFIVSDDTLLNPWNLEKFDKEKIWRDKINVFNCREGIEPWVWWSQYDKNGERLNEFLDDLKANFSYGPRPHTPIVNRFFKNLRGRCMMGFADVFYVPVKYLKAVVFLFEEFRNRHIFLDLAIPMVLGGVEKTNKILEFNDTIILFESDRLNIWNKYKATPSIFLHPIKFSNRMNVRPFCKLYINNSN